MGMCCLCVVDGPSSASPTVHTATIVMTLIMTLLTAFHLSVIQVAPSASSIYRPATRAHYVRKSLRPNGHAARVPVEEASLAPLLLSAPFVISSFSDRLFRYPVIIPSPLSPLRLIPIYHAPSIARILEDKNNRN